MIDLLAGGPDRRDRRHGRSPRSIYAAAIGVVERGRCAARPCADAPTERAEFEHKLSASCAATCWRSISCLFGGVGYWIGATLGG